MILARLTEIGASKSARLRYSTRGVGIEGSSLGKEHRMCEQRSNIWHLLNYIIWR